MTVPFDRRGGRGRFIPLDPAAQQARDQRLRQVREEQLERQLAKLTRALDAARDPGL